MLPDREVPRKKTFTAAVWGEADEDGITVDGALAIR